MLIIVWRVTFYHLLFRDYLLLREDQNKSPKISNGPQWIILQKLNFSNPERYIDVIYPVCVLHSQTSYG